MLSEVFGRGPQPNGWSEPVDKEGLLTVLAQLAPGKPAVAAPAEVRAGLEPKLSVERSVFQMGSLYLSEGPYTVVEEASFKTQRGSASSFRTDSNLVLTSRENRDGIVIKKFREVKSNAEKDSLGSSQSIGEFSRQPVVFQEFSLHQVVTPDPASASEATPVSTQVPAPTPVSAQAKDPVPVSVQPPAPAPTPAPAPIDPGLSLASARPETQSDRSAKKVSEPGLGLSVRDPSEAKSALSVQVPEVSRRLDLLTVRQTPGKWVSRREGGREVSSAQEASRLLSGEVAEVVLQNEARQQFEGVLVDGRMSGFGRLLDGDGRLLFEGDFVDGKFHGLGVLHRPGPAGDFSFLRKERIDAGQLGRGWTRFEGLFREGRFHGRGYLFFGERFVLLGVFEGGELESGCVLREEGGRPRRLERFGQEWLGRGTN